MTKVSLNELDKKLAALRALEESSVSSASSASSEDSESVSEDGESGFSGYSCDSSSSDESDDTEDGSDRDDTRKPLATSESTQYDKKANQMVRKKARAGMSCICFKNLVGKCSLSDCIYHHVTLSELTEDEKGELVRELHKRPFDSDLGNLVKNMNIPICKTYSKTGECKFQLKCKFWHIDSENVAKWAGSHFWCANCRKAFTSDSQYREHCNGKFHKQNTSR